MCNCGKGRPAAAGALMKTHSVRDVRGLHNLHGASPPTQPLFEYVGATALTVIGPVSGRRYRFERTGARLTADPRDGNALQTVPFLRMRAHP